MLRKDRDLRALNLLLRVPPEIIHDGIYIVKWDDIRIEMREDTRLAWAGDTRRIDELSKSHSPTELLAALYDNIYRNMAADIATEPSPTHLVEPFLMGVMSANTKMLLERGADPAVARATLDLIANVYIPQRESDGAKNRAFRASLVDLRGLLGA